MRRLSPLLLLLTSVALTGALADSDIPLDYVPPRARQAIADYVPGARLMEARIGNDDEYGPKYRCEYFRAGHKGNITVSERGHLLDLDEDLAPSQIPRSIARIIAREARGGAVRKAHLDEDHGRLVYEVEAYYGQSSAKLKLKVARDGTVLDRDYD